MMVLINDDDISKGGVVEVVRRCWRGFGTDAPLLKTGGLRRFDVLKNSVLNDDA
jgi:hypothetical protein